MSFHVGQKVACVNDRKWPEWAIRDRVALPVAGQIYTVRGVMSFSKGPVIYLGEISNSSRCINDDTGLLIEPGFPSARFRPIVENKSSISFTMGADPESERWDNRVRIPAKI